VTTEQRCRADRDERHTASIGDVALNLMGLPEVIPEAVSNIPKRYNSIDTSGFTVDVTGLIRDLKFELKSAK
jgi:hypothetical protein